MIFAGLDVIVSPPLGPSYLSSTLDGFLKRVYGNAGRVFKSRNREGAMTPYEGFYS
jgi:hypothetical protein